MTHRYAPPRIVRAAPAINAPRHLPSQVAPQQNPYVDYSRTLTLEGGILLTFKAIDDRLRHVVCAIILWSVATGLEIWFCDHFASRVPGFQKFLFIAAAAFVNYLIVAKPVEIYRTIEIRPDCMIFDRRDLFWRHYMENDWPAFRPNKEGGFTLAGIYGTRQVEFLTLPRFDELDRAPEVLAAHLQDALRQLWQPR